MIPSLFIDLYIFISVLGDDFVLVLLFSLRQNFFDRLIEPLLQIKLPPLQCDIPPIFPEQGVFEAKDKFIEVINNIDK